MSLVCLIVLASCSPRGGKLVMRTLDAPSLAANRMGISNHQQLAIYLPRSYQEGSHRYPVLYWLPNFNTCLWRYSGGAYQRFHLRQSMDRLIVKGAAQEMIVVIPNATHMLGGSWYRNSPLTGNWEDFIVKDVVEYMDSHFRTIPSANARGLVGHGMGGTGALEIALGHPDRFSCVYALSPGLFDENGLLDSEIIGEKQRLHWHNGIEQWKNLDESTQRKSFRDYIQTRLNSPSREQSLEGLFVSYGAAMAPDLSLPYPHISFPEPGARGAGETNLAARFENGFGGWRDKVANYLSLGTPLRSITIECTRNDDLRWIPRGADYVSKLMRGMGVTNELILHDGSHDSSLGWRLETAMLPAISMALSVKP